MLPWGQSWKPSPLKAYLNLRHNNSERASIFTRGLQRLGYHVVAGWTERPEPDDLAVTWNRIGQADHYAARFHKVLVAENATWGNDFTGGPWLTLCRDHHNLASSVTGRGPERWDRIKVEPSPFRTEGETVILSQRGIGTNAPPPNWQDSACKRYGGRIRKHPGRLPAKPLLDDLAKAGRVITWGSGAAVKALLAGIPVVSEMPDWLAEQDNTEPGRLAMLRKLAWGQWRLTEIESGEAFHCALSA